ncbi:MAG: hypothetical protein Q4C00_08520, partial [Bacillota bacterium]|nr:hypothetical protein [Bacillota bacterium]
MKKRFIITLLCLCLALTLTPMAALADDAAAKVEPQIVTSIYISAALDEDGVVWVWGSNNFGQLAKDPEAMASSSYPIKVEGFGGAKIVKIAVGIFHVLALDENGVLWGWGNTNDGSLGADVEGTITVTVGTDDFEIVTAPVKIKGLEGVEILDIAAGYGHSIALDKSGNVWTWGRNDYGQLGYGRTGNSNPEPKKVIDTASSTNSLSNIIAIATGNYHNLALDSSGKVWAWGYNDSGQLGNDKDYALSGTPAAVAIPAGTTIEAIAAGRYNGMALDSTGQVWIWGSDANSNLGPNTNADQAERWPMSNTPNTVGGDLPAIKAIDATYSSAAALDNSNTVWTWGNNAVGQLGRDTQGNSTDRNPGKVTALEGK